MSTKIGFYCYKIIIEISQNLFKQALFHSGAPIVTLLQLLQFFFLGVQLLSLRRKHYFCKKYSSQWKSFKKKCLSLRHNRLIGMKYNELENNVVSVTDTETMDLETARQLLHQMVKKVYAQPW